MQVTEVTQTEINPEHVGHALRGEGHMMQMLLDTSPDGIFIKDLNGRYTTINKIVAHMLGLANPEDAYGRTDADFFPPEIVQMNLAEEQEILKTGAPAIDRESKITLLTREEIWLSVTRVPLYDADENVVGIFGVSRDITERKRTEARLHESEELYRSLVETAPDAISLSDLDGKLLLCNEQCAAMYGYAATDDILGRNVFEFVAPEEQKWLKKTMRKLLRNESYRGMEHEMVRQDGTRFTIELSASLVKNSAGKPTGVLIVARDITERKRAATAAAFERYLLNSLMETLPDSIYFKDRESKFTLVNQALSTSLGLSDPSEAIGKSDADFFSKELAGLSYTDEQEIIRTGIPLLGQEEREVWPDGHETWFLTKKVPLWDADDRIVGTFGISSDITERKRVERMKNEFVSMVSHELRTPLTSIRGSLGLIAGGVAGEVSPQVKAMVDIAYNNSERLVRLINDILDIEKIESGKMVFELRPTALLPLVKQAIAATQSYAEQYGVRFTLTENVGEATANIDSDRMIQVLTNLLSNAAKFSPHGDEVEITVERQDGKVRLSVADHGPGISEEFKKHIFQKFAQADSSATRQKGGTGLGLSISKAIVETFGGDLLFTTTPGEGATFYFDLPEWQIYTPDEARTDGSGASKPPHILICEDDADVAHLLNIMLSQGGFTCDIAHNVAEARKLLEEHVYNAMTLDLMLPDEDGLSLIREMREAALTHNLPIVVVSARAQLGKSELNGNAAAVIDWLNKPIDQNQLLLSVRRATHQRKARPSILHVEDDPDIVRIVEIMLRELADVSNAPTLAEAHRRLAKEHFDLVILDVGLPDGTGLELLSQMNETDPSTSVVLFSAREVTAAEAGSVDATLVKTRTSNEKMLSTITDLINKNRGLQKK